MTRPAALPIPLLAALLLGGSLAACRTGPATPQQECARQADDAPAVKDLVMKGVGNLSFQFQNEEQLKAARQDATNACLRARGILRGGGVERPRPQYQ